MKINKSAKSFKKPLIVTILSVALLAGGYTALAYTQQIWPFTEEFQADTTDHEVEPEVSNANDTEYTTEENPEATTRSQTSSDSEPSKQLTPGNTEDTGVKPTISHATQSDGSIEVVATFNTTANGTCRLTLSKPGEQNINRESPITIGPSYYICGFTVDGVSGTGWTATVTHANNNSISDAVNQRVE